MAGFLRKWFARRTAILSPKKFHKRLRSYKMRAFSLVVFEDNDATDSHRQMSSLAQFINERKRSGDIVGWYTRQHIGVLLSDAGAEDAEIFARNIRHGFPDKMVSTRYMVHTHSEKRSEGTGHRANIVNIENYLRQEAEERQDSATLAGNIG